MKKTLSSLFGLLLWAAPAVQAQYSYTTNDGTISITYYLGPGGDVAIPATISGLPVTSIGDNAFDNTGVASVTIPSSVTSIGGAAFEYCSSLTSITIPGSVTNLGSAAFNECVSLTSISIPGGVSSIESGTFNYCTSLTNATISSGVTSIGSRAFAGCTSLQSVMIPASVTNIVYLPFDSCTSLTEIAVDHQNSIYSSLGGVLFDENQTTLLEFPAGLGGSYTIPGSVTSIGENAFAVTSVASVIIPGNVTVIGAGAFAGGGLANVSIGYGVTSIGDNAFIACPNLASVTIPGSVTYFGYQAFKGCESLMSVTIDGGVPTISELAFYGCLSLNSLIIGSGVTSIGGGAFGFCGNLASVTIPGTVTNIGDVAFGNCTSLRDVTLSCGVSDIGPSAFSGCTSLANITIPSSVTSIEETTFAYCSSLTNVTIANGLTNIGYQAFGGCLSLTSLYFEGNAPTFVPGVFPDETNATVFYLAGTTGWKSSFAGRPTVLWNPLSFAANADADTLIGYSGPIMAITIPATNNGEPVTKIGADAFFGSSLTRITIPAGVTSIGNEAFASSSNLTSVYFLGNAPAAGSNVFLDDYPAIYYLPGTTGWSNSFAGRPTVLWNPLIQTGGGDFGVLNNEFGFDIIASNNFTVVVQATTNLANPVWSPLQSLTLTNGLVHFSDPLQMNSPGRFYRLSPP